jgi:hypothetical protein
VSDERTIDPHYAWAQLAQSLRAIGAHDDPALRDQAAKRAERWRRVLDDLADGLVRAGQRQPTDMPVWVTPVVLRGGFASSETAAGGDLRPHEVAVAGDVPAPDVRRTANEHFVTLDGLAQLGERLARRDYRIEAPEESALLVVRWLIERGERESAAALIEVIAPFFDRLRFHPIPASPRPAPGEGIDVPLRVANAADIARSLRRKRPSKQVEAMREAVEVWAPLTDRFITLVLETCVDGMPFRTKPGDFEARRAELIVAHAAARKAHRLCMRPHGDGEVLEVMHRAIASDDATRGWTVSQVKTRLDEFIRAHGAPGSERHRALRRSQAIGPSHAVLAHGVATRLEAVPFGDGVEPLEAFTAPIDGQAVPPRVTTLLTRAIDAPLKELIERGLVPSAETMGKLLPQLTGVSRATRFDDVRARSLYASLYRTFRARRSLLLLGLQHQVRFEELPWVLALETTRDRDPKDALRSLLREIVTLAIRAYPATQMPNTLVAELSSLATEAALDLPLVEELAADIFMGKFSLKFLRAAQKAASVGSLYARYYGLDYARVCAFDRIEEHWNVKTCPDFDAYCVELAALPSGGSSRARNGCVIEQASILTTHNLAVLVDALAIELPWIELVRAAYRDVLARLEHRVLNERAPTRTRMRASRQLAFAWRQMLFFLSRVADPRVFVTEAEATLATRPKLASFAPYLRGLDAVIAGSTLPRADRLYGWSIGRHELLRQDEKGRSV